VRLSCFRKSVWPIFVHYSPPPPSNCLLSSGFNSYSSCETLLFPAICVAYLCPLLQHSPLLRIQQLQILRDSPVSDNLCGLSLSTTPTLSSPQDPTVTNLLRLSCFRQSVWPIFVHYSPPTLSSPQDPTVTNLVRLSCFRQSVWPIFFHYSPPPLPTLSSPQDPTVANLLGLSCSQQSVWPIFVHYFPPTHLISSGFKSYKSFETLLFLAVPRRLFFATQQRIAIT
jgi:hypothetical protein